MGVCVLIGWLAGPPIGFEIATENADEFILYPGPNQGFELWKPQAHVAPP